MQEFDGKVPTLTGIRVDESTTVATAKQVTATFEQSKFTVGNTMHRFPLRSMAGPTTGIDLAFSLLFYSSDLKHELDDLRSSVGTPQKLAAAKANMEKLDALAADLEKKAATLDAALARFDANIAAALTKMDAAEVSRLQAEVKKLRRATAGFSAFATKAEAFAVVGAGDPPPLLDCTAGVDAKTAQAAQAAWAKYLGKKVVEEIDLGGGASMKFCLIPPGKYRRGSPDGSGEAGERPQHTVVLTSPVYLGMYEVTQGQYEQLTGKNPSHFQVGEGGPAELKWLAKDGADAVKGLAEAERKNLPVEQVTWDEATVFGSLLTKKLPTGWGKAGLPTEAEWEYACRAGTTTAYWSGNDEAAVKRVGWYGLEKDGLKRTQPVGKLEKNPWGLYDIHGNVCEWCLDRGGPYRASDQVDPQGQLTGDDRVLRGGSWDKGLPAHRAAYRIWPAPTRRDFNYGFRVCLRLD